jgi:uncharacterized ferredoxin-like protein
MDRESNAVGLIGIGAWLLGVIFVVCGLCGVFNTAHQVKPEEPLVTQGPQCTLVYPRGFKLQKETKKISSSKTCTNGEFGSTWRACTPRTNT